MGPARPKQRIPQLLNSNANIMESSTLALLMAEIKNEKSKAECNTIYHFDTARKATEEE